MQIQKVNYSTNFNGHGAKNLGDVMNKLYREAYRFEFVPHEPDIIQLSSRMNDGVEVSAVANFIDGRFVGISFPYEFTQYKSQFCNKLFETYNKSVTKGKASHRRISHN